MFVVVAVVLIFEFEAFLVLAIRRIRKKATPKRAPVEYM